MGPATGWPSRPRPALSRLSATWTRRPMPERRHVRRRRQAPAEVFADLDSALRATGAEAALVTTAVEWHVPVALDALAAGLHVLLEKPFAPDPRRGAVAGRARGSERHGARSWSARTTATTRRPGWPRSSSPAVRSARSRASRSTSGATQFHGRHGQRGIARWPTRCSRTWRSISSTCSGSSSDASPCGSRWSR